MRTRNDKLIRAVAPAVLGVVMMLAAYSAISVIVDLTGRGPNVGDIITFETGRAVPEASNVRLLVDRVKGLACVLDLDTISHRGGSMILEARLPGDLRSFFLHWAGANTSVDAADCGPSANLVVDRHDIDVLAFAAGGFGVEPKNPTVLTQGTPFMGQ